MPKFPYRFSLATMLLVVTIVCLSAALWSSSKQLQDAKEELEACRNELGYLTINDDAKLHWIRVPRPGDLQWQWRVYVPEANRFKVWVADDRIPQIGTAKIYKGGISLPAGEVTLHASVYRDHNGDRKFRIEALEMPGLSVNVFDMEGTHAEWLNDRGWRTEAGNARTEMFAADGEAILLRLRAGKWADKTDEQGRPGKELRFPDGPSQGLMIWITDSKKVKTQLKNNSVG